MEYPVANVPHGLGGQIIAEEWRDPGWVCSLPYYWRNPEAVTLSIPGQQHHGILSLLQVEERRLRISTYSRRMRKCPATLFRPVSAECEFRKTLAMLMRTSIWVMVMAMVQGMMAGPLAEAPVSPGKPALGSVFYEAQSPVLTGTMEASVTRSTWREAVTPLPYEVPSEIAREFAHSHEGTEILCVKGTVACNVLPHYYQESYIDLATGMPLRSVRWTDREADVILDFVKPGMLLITRAKWPSPGAGDLLRAILVPGSEPTKPSPKVESMTEAEAVGEAVTDLLTALLRLPPRFSHADSIDTPVYCFAVKKRMTSIHCAKFAPREISELDLTINGKAVTRKARRFSWSLNYACPAPMPSESTVTAIQEAFYPEHKPEETAVLLKEMFGADLTVIAGKTVAIPVSSAVHTAFFHRAEDEGFESPYGISEDGEVWFDVVSGMPLLISGGVHGLRGDVYLRRVTGTYAEWLDLAND